LTAESRRTQRSHSAAELQLNEVGFEEPAVWSQKLSFVRKASSWLGGEMREGGYLISLYYSEPCVEATLQQDLVAPRELNL
jgi:hypothetical protein